MKFLRVMILLLLMEGCAHGGTRTQSTLPEFGASVLPVTKVVLYRNGVAYVERRGTVKDNVFTLMVKPSQMVDVIKSLMVLELSGSGEVVNVSMALDKARIRELEEIPPEIRNVNGLMSLLRAFHGAMVTIVDGDGDTYTGRVVGISNIGNKDKPLFVLSILTRSGSVVARPLDSISSLRLRDRTLTIALDKALSLTAVHGRWKPVELTVRLSGEPPHDVVVGYVVDAPVWKPTYRIVVGEDHSLLLQGWAVVQNLSGVDWEAVKLILSAGAPVSFRYDLSRPTFVRRPDLTPPEMVEGERPPELRYAEAEEKRLEAAPPMSGSVRARKRAARRPKMALAPAPSAMSEDVFMDMSERSTLVRARTRHTGPVYYFEMTSPITIHDGQASLVAVLSTKMEGREILYYSLSQHDQGDIRPYRALKFTNTTGVPLEAGPLEVYRAGAFQGEALIKGIAPGAMALIPYAKESAISVNVDTDRTSKVQRIFKISGGVAVVEERKVLSYKVKILSNGEKGITLYLLVPKVSSMELAQDINAVEEGDHYYVPIELDGGKVVRNISMYSRVRTKYSLLSSGGWPRIHYVRMMLEAENLPKPVKQKLQKVIAMWKERSAVMDQLSLVERKTGLIKDELREYRETLKSLGKSKNVKLRRKLERKMGELTRELSSLMEKRAELRSRKFQIERDIQKLLSSITFVQ